MGKPFNSNEPGPVERYMAARVPDASTLGDCYVNYNLHPKAFVGGVQYALDKLLFEVDQIATIPHMTDFLHAHALRILENAKIGEPQ